MRTVACPLVQKQIHLSDMSRMYNIDSLVSSLSAPQIFIAYSMKIERESLDVNVLSLEQALGSACKA